MTQTIPATDEGQANAFNAMAFRKALGAFPTGVTVITTHCEQQGDIGLTANSFNSVSLDPPMVLWSLAKTASCFEVFQKAEYFAIHILSDKQQDVSQRFATKGIDKFADLSLERGALETPLLSDCAARFECRSQFQYEGGDHIIFVGEVISFSASEAQPLLFHAGRYGRLEPGA